MISIRKFTEKDIPFVAALYQKANLASDPGLPKPSLQNIGEGFNELFLRNPWRDENLSSLVCEDRSGAVVGFLGISPRRMAIKGRPILAAVSSHLMVEPGRRLGLAGVRLLQQFLSGPQELSIADQSTEIGRKVWDGIGGRTSHIHSLEWVKVLRPSAHALSVAAGKFHVPGWLAYVTGPLVRLSDLSRAR